MKTRWSLSPSRARGGSQACGAVPRALRAAALSVCAALAACEGQGEGQLEGALFVRGCPLQGSDDPQGMPAPLPPFRLDPTFFSAEPLPSLPPTQNADRRNISRLAIRAQRDGSAAERTDGLLLYLTDIDALRGAVGKPLPLLDPPLTDPGVPLPSAPRSGVKAALYLNGTCPFARAQAYLQGTVTFTQLGDNLGDAIAAQLDVTVTDPRSARAAIPAADQDAAGALRGSLRLTVQSGPATFNP